MVARFILAATLICLCGIAVAGETIRDCSVCPTMVKVHGGSFLMGTAKADLTEDESSDDERQHKVTIKRSFAIGQYPVTRGEFAVSVRETRHDPRGCFMRQPGDDVPQVVLKQGLSWRNPGFAQTDRDPVVCVSFDDAKRYVRWLSKRTSKSYRLPSEAEWEYAARAGTRTERYWTGPDARACRFANVRDSAAAKEFNTGKDEEDAHFRCRDGYIYTAPVGSFLPNPFGLYDMLGNVWQWTADCYSKDYSGAVDDDGQCGLRVLRGGSWADGPERVRSAYRLGYDPDDRTIFNGIRVARKL